MKGRLESKLLQRKRRRRVRMWPEILIGIVVIIFFIPFYVYVLSKVASAGKMAGIVHWVKNKGGKHNGEEKKTEKE